MPWHAESCLVLGIIPCNSDTTKECHLPIHFNFVKLVQQVQQIFGIFLMRQAIETIPDDYIDAARIDGCSEFRIFFSLILPSVRPAMATLLIIKFMWNWNEFFWPMVVISSPQMKVVTMGLMSFTNMYFIEYNLLTAAAVISILPILLIFITLQRWVVQAVVMSGLKG